MARRRGESATITRRSTNVFQDLGYPDAAERQAKLRLAYTLNQVLEDRQLSQGDAAKMLGVTQPKVSALRHYKLAGFSVERLMNLLTALDRWAAILVPTGRVEARSSRRGFDATARRCSMPAHGDRTNYIRVATKTLAGRSRVVLEGIALQGQGRAEEAIDSLHPPARRCVVWRRLTTGGRWSFAALDRALNQRRNERL